MPSKQGDLSLLETPLAQQLLQSKIPARLAYNWTDGTPRVVPIWFVWNGREIVICSPAEAPKVKAMRDGAHVALTIDNDTLPHKVLLIRGTVRVDVVDGIAPEYAAAAHRYLGDEGGEAWHAQARVLWPRTARILITPAWAGMIDFETRFPSTVETAMARVQGAQEGSQ